MKCLKKFYKENASKIKDIGLVAFAISLIGIGYINFAQNDNTSIENKNLVAKSTNSLGDVELVSTNAIVENEVALVENEEIIETDNEKVQTEEDYFTEVKLNRNIMFDESLDAYEKILENTTISSEQKAIAIKEIDKITKIKSGVTVAEELIILKGFENAAILVNGENVNVIVRIAVLSKEQVAQIQNIVMKELGVEVQNISITTK